MPWVFLQVNVFSGDEDGMWAFFIQSIAAEKKVSYPQDYEKIVFKKNLLAKCLILKEKLMQQSQIKVF